jgi:hypothetical protein
MAFSMTVSPDLGQLGEEIGRETIESTKRGLRAAADLVPDFIQETFVVQGARGGNPKWKRLTFRSIAWRKNYPHSGGFAAQRSYFEQHEPLIDTGTLRDSFVVSEEEGGLRMIITSSTEYGYRHEDPSSTTPDGQAIWMRPHLFIVEGEDTDRMDAAFEGAWSE